jgi:diguanylate cyclase (GGDEF)-like protein/putative nucleotidyltransferase with HDIG domain
MNDSENILPDLTNRRPMLVNPGLSFYATAGLLTCALTMVRARISNPSEFLAFLACAIVVALGARAVANSAVVPAGFLFLLLGLDRLTAPELLFVGLAFTLLDELQQTEHPCSFVSVMTGLAATTLGILSARVAYSATLPLWHDSAFPAPWIAGSFVLMFNHCLAAGLKERTPFAAGIYKTRCRPLLPWTIAGAYLAYLVREATLSSGYHPALVALPIIYVLDRGCRSWFAARAVRKEELASLHQNTLETLAVAIDTRDHTTKSHLRRVQVYAVAMGEELGLIPSEIEALHVAALLHDIGKLAIPDHILLKPGSLTEEEWEKMKTHCEIGAAMLARMNFPESVLAIVRAHHEKWDGSGYPRGLSGEQIPLGARILSAVDCLDALASDRPYRTGLPLAEAMGMVSAESGRGFDPRIVIALEREFVNLEKRVMQAAAEAPGAAFGSAGSSQEDLRKLANRLRAESDSSSILAPIVCARQETQMLQELAGELTHAAGLDEVVAAVQKHLGQIVHFDTMGIYIRRNDSLEPVRVVGPNQNLFSRSAFPIKQGLSGWVAQHRSPVLNGNPAHESGYLNDSQVIYKLQSALGVLFEGRSGVNGVLTLYHPDRNAFSRDDLRIVQAANLKIGPAIENALRFQDVEESAVTDHLTGIPNARALKTHLDRELSRAGRENSTVGVLLCDLDGFKQVNDKFGHLTGNEVLQKVASGLRDNCRGSEYLARMGGDEFVLIVPGLKQEAAELLNRMRGVAEEAGWMVCGEQCLSMSVGVATYPLHGEDARSLLLEADRRMYRDKQQRKSAARSANLIEESIEESMVEKQCLVLGA